MSEPVNGTETSRLEALENQMKSQNEEITSLKSQLNDMMRRLSEMEGKRAQTGRTTGQNRRPATSRSEAAPAKSRQSMAPRSANHNATAGSNVRPSTGGRPASKLAVSRSKHDGFGSKETHAINKNEGYVKLTLRGRSQKLQAPANYLDALGDGSRAAAPDSQLKLEWVYGYRGRDCRNNVFVLPTGEAMYFVAAVVVLHNLDDGTQRHYLGHNDDIKCMSLHPDKITVATGQVAGHDKAEGKPHVRVWNSVNLSTLHVLGLGFFERAISCVAFSKADGGQLLAAVDESNEHVLSVWEWQSGDKGRKLADSKSSGDPVVGLDFHPQDNKQLITCGKNHIAFWTHDGSSLSKRSGIFESHDRPKFILCVAFAENGDVLTGDSNGAIICWDRANFKIKSVKSGIHEKGTLCLWVEEDGQLLSGGGDGRVVQLNAQLEPTGKTVQLADANTGVRTVVPTQPAGSLLIGTKHNQLVKSVLADDAAAADSKVVVRGQHDETWGLATHPSQPQFVTCAYDKLLTLWDSNNRTLIWQTELAEAAHCVDFHPNASFVAVGFRTAAFAVINVTTQECIIHQECGAEQIEAIRYSPDGSYLAAASRDNFIYLFQVEQDGTSYRPIGKCVGHSSFVTHIDWSTDSQFLQSNSGDYELLYWNAEKCSRVTSGMKDVEWATQTCTISFGTCGVWPQGADGTDVNACVRSRNSELLASADDFGKVNLYRFPCCVPKAGHHSYGGHSSHVTNVAFLADDSRLISTGGQDCAVFQWCLA